MPRSTSTESEQQQQQQPTTDITATLCSSSPQIKDMQNIFELNNFIAKCASMCPGALCAYICAHYKLNISNACGGEGTKPEQGPFFTIAKHISNSS